jgi:primosomal protein N' (replication factor Y)
MYADIVFPLKLPPLTYRVPSNVPSDLKGRIVKAPLMNRGCYGLVIDVMDEPEKSGNIIQKDIKEIQSIHHRFVSESTLTFLKWLSEYYLMPMGTALKSCFFEEAIKIGHVINCKEQITKTEKSEVRNRKSEFSIVCNSIKEKNYKSFLLHAPSVSDERSFLLEIFKDLNSDIRDAIILVPEIWQIEGISSSLHKMFGDRIAVIHSRLNRSKRIETVNRIISGKSDIIIGTRSAVLAPVKNISFIAVMSEHSPAYKGEEGLRYNARDVAVMRGFTEKSCVLLSSVCPSTESFHNSTIGKYTLLGNFVKKTAGRPEIKIIDMRGSRIKDISISGEVLKKAKELLQKKESFLFLVSRKGYSLIRCNDCGYVARCSRCRIPLVFYKSKSMVRCNYCGFEGNVPHHCEECNGFDLKPYGAGAERVKEELENLTALSVLQTKDPDLLSDFTPFVIGTAHATKKASENFFGTAALLNTDALLSRPDFRAYERTFQEIIQASHFVKQEGSIFLQTWSPANKILKFIKQYDFDGFYKYELSQRKIMDYPPFSKIILFNMFLKGIRQKTLGEIQKIIDDSNITNVEILGPVEIPSSLKSYRHCFQMLIKSKDRKTIHTAAKNLLNKLEKIKGIKINVDVDPLKI